jgi:uncharacterized protein (DUF58 family)
MIEKQNNDKALNHNIYADIDQLRRLQFQARGFDFRSSQSANSILSGNNVSKLRGRGLNFEELRQYRPGDDIRNMDWKVTQRTGKPHIKVYTEERERNVYMAIDQRSSMFFGSTNKMKSVVAAELAALAAWRITEYGDRIGALVFNDDELKVVPARRGRQHVVRLLSEVVKQNRQLQNGSIDRHPSDSLNKMLAKLESVCGHDALVLLIGDGNGWNKLSAELIKKLSQHNEIIACDIFDPLERNLPEMTQMVVSDGKYQIQLSSKDNHTKKKYRMELDRQMNLYADMARKYRIPLISVNTIASVEQQLRKAFGQVTHNIKAEEEKA